MKVCSKTGELFLAGYVVKGGEMYIKHGHDLFVVVTEAGYETLDEAYDDEFFYWSEWGLEEVLEEDWELVAKSYSQNWELWLHNETGKEVKIPIAVVRDVEDLI